MMLFRNIDKWDAPAKTPTMLYFAQLLEEMLFEYSLDTYKASVMHTGLLCSEARTTIDAIEAGTIKHPNIYHVTAELAANFEKDMVAVALSPLPLTSITPSLKNKTTPLKELSTILELLLIQLSPLKYRAKNEELLFNAISSGNQIAQVRQLTRSYITTLTATGLNASYIYDKTKEFFHYGDGRITGPESIKTFFTLFPQEDLKYTVVFRTEKIFEHVSSAFKSIGLEITKSPPENIDLSPHHAFTSQQGLYATIRKIQARDPYSARDDAENIMKISSTLLTLFHHKERPSWSKECITLENSSGMCTLVNTPTNPIHKCADLHQSVASKKLQEFIREFSLEVESSSRFIRSAQLHALAVGSNSSENQILNLWIALESLIPSETKSDDISNIEHIIASLVPFLNFGYIERLTNNLARDLLYWNSKGARSILKDVPGKKLSEKIARILSLSEFEKIKRDLDESFKDFHLLRDRLNYFSSIFSSPKSIADALDAHKQRIEWQIRRIYRTRNIIVHSGTTPRHTTSLIEHTHNYLDTVLSLLIQLASKPKAIHSVAQGFKYVELRYSEYHKSLLAKGATFDSSNIISLAYCR